MGASINNQTKTQNLHKKQNVQKIKKTQKNVSKHGLCPLKISNPFKENPKNPILLCFMTFVHQLQLLRPPFAAWVSAVLLELRPGKVTRVMARP